MDKKESMMLVLRALSETKQKLTDTKIIAVTGLSLQETTDALSMLLTRRLVCCDSFEPSKRGGQAGVRRWGVSHFAPLWYIAEGVDPEEIEIRI